MERKHQTKGGRFRLKNLIILLVSCGVFAYSAVQLFLYWKQAHQSQAEQQALIDQAVVIINPVQSDRPIQPAEETEEAMETQQPLVPEFPIYVDFESLVKENADIVAWLYCEDTVINYPVVRGEDNAYYLNHTPDGSSNANGSIFMDFRNLSDFSDFNTIIYGHNMTNDTMFGTLQNYSNQEYFEQHPSMWIITADTAYRLDLFAGLVTASDSDAYQLFNSRDELHAHLEYAQSQSVFDAGEMDISAMEHVVTLSTCSYEFPTARFILIGNLVPVSYPVQAEN